MNLIDDFEAQNFLYIGRHQNMESETSLPSFKIVEENKKFLVRDGKNTNYGGYSSCQEAQQAIDDWVAYYEAALVF